jgi:hypothetical protein
VAQNPTDADALAALSSGRERGPGGEAEDGHQSD